MHDVALILGGADCVWDDVARIEEMVGGEWAGPIIACNEIGADWPRYLHHWVTYHPENFWGYQDRAKKFGGHWVRRRERQDHPPGACLWSARDVPLYAHREAVSWLGGSSGLLSASVANTLREEGAIRLGVLCGIPITKTPHYHERDGGKPWKYADSHYREWVSNLDKMLGWLRSMGGRTQDLLGEPTLTWLLGGS